MAETEKLPILLQDGTIVKVDMTIFRVVERNMYNPRYGREKNSATNFPAWSGELHHVLHEDKVIRIQEGFNSRVFVLRDKKGIERFFSVKMDSRYDRTDMLFGTKKRAAKYIIDENRKDLNLIKEKIAKSTDYLTKAKKAERMLKSNLAGL